MRDINDEEKAQYPIVEDCVRAVRYPGGRTAGVMPFLFTWAIVSDFDHAGYRDRWCFETLGDALGALEAWDGEAEPEGWHRHPNSGRRMDKQGNPIGTW